MDNFDYSVIGQRIKTLRKHKGLNQTQLANLLGKSLRTVQKYETGEIEVSIDVVNELAKILDTTPTFILGYETNTAPIRNLADVLNFLFELDKATSLKFDIDVKKPPRSNEWTCSIRFNGKEMDAEHNADMCLFLEQWEDMREEVRSFSASPAKLHKWQAQTLAYYAGSSVECVEPEELDESERIAQHNAYLEMQYNSKKGE
ncbi:MAG: helix-turn-helix transcriptional regulator [Enterocloster clostridioformis]|jgi:Predicted transcriptional regulator|nr:helix-turn-helix transcriptional regulator [Enterocloster clostridioformis]